MIIRNATKQDVKDALNTVNLFFGDNIIFNRFDSTSATRHQVTLRVESSKGLGFKRGFSGRRTTSACWHVHGVFIDSLPIKARIFSSPFNKWVKPGDCWNDKNIGSLMNPQKYSDACDCPEDNPEYYNLIPLQGANYHHDHWGN